MVSFGSRVAATVMVGVGWIAFVLLWIAFCAGSFDFWQNVAILFASTIIAIGVTAVLWIKWVLG